MTPAQEALPFNGFLYGAVQFLSILFMYPTGSRSALRFILQLVVTAFLGWACYHIITETTTGDKTADLAVGSAILTQYMIAIDGIFFSDPNTLRRTIDQPGAITKRPFWEKLWWTLDLYTNARGIDWQHEPSDLPPRPRPSMGRWEFVASRLIIAGLCTALESAFYIVNASNPGATTPGVLLTQAEWKYRALGVLGFAAAGFARINMLHCMVSVLAVGSGFSAPQRWPRLFGSPLEGYTIQRVWRRVWHQLLRKSLLSCTTFITTKIMRFPPLSRRPSLVNSIHKVVLLFVAFIIIGLVHIGGDVMLLRTMCWGSFKFFAFQPFAIIAEKMVFAIWTGLGLSVYPKDNNHKVGHGEYPLNGNGNGRHEKSEASHPAVRKAELKPYLWIRLVGYVWVGMYLTYSLAFMVDALVSIQMLTDPKADLRQNTFQDVLKHLSPLK